MGAETEVETHSLGSQDTEVVCSVRDVGGMGKKLGQYARRTKQQGCELVVGMKLTTACREMLTWTIAKLAHPGDQVLALHVSSFPTHAARLVAASCDKEREAHQRQLASTLHGMLSVYQGLCTLKQIKLHLEIVNGTKVRKILVEVARTHGASKLILGTNQHFPIGLTSSLGKYCLKRLPSTCTVVIVEHGKIVFDKKGTQFAVLGSGLLKVILKRIRSLGRTKEVNSGGTDEATEADEGRPSVSLPPTLSRSHQPRGVSLVNSSTECDRISDLESNSCSGSLVHGEFPSSPISVLPSATRDCILGPEGFRISFSKQRAEGPLTGWNPLNAGRDGERGDLFLLRYTGKEEPAVSADLDSYQTAASCSLDNLPGDDSADSAPGSAEECLHPGWPLMHRSISFDKNPAPHSSDRNLSVVNWALQLPHRPRVAPACMPKESVNAQCARLLGELSPGAFISQEFVKEASSLCPSRMSCNPDEFYTTKIRFSINIPDRKAHCKGSTEGNSLLSLAQQLDQLCVDQPCIRFSFEELAAATANFSPRNLVGRGGGSLVYRGESCDGKLLAVKCLNQGGSQAEEELLTDIEINSALQHCHIVALLGYCVDSTHLILVYDFLSEGNLDDHLHGGNEAPIVKWDVRQKVAVGIAKALDYLHGDCPRPVIHRDVKASNILLSADFEPKLSDFGLAKWAPTNASYVRCNDVVGTFGYLAPEYFMYGRVNDKTDVYSFGVVLLELITGRLPIDTSRPKGQENLVIWARPLLEERHMGKLVDPQLEGTFDVAQMQNMMRAAALCVQQSAQRRPRMSRVLKILCGEGESVGFRTQRHPLSMDLDEAGSNFEGTPNCGGEIDIQTHLALAMLGVEDADAADDDVASQCSVDQSSVDLTHSSKYLEEYLAGRFSRSASFD